MEYRHLSKKLVVFLIILVLFFLALMGYSGHQGRPSDSGFSNWVRSVRAEVKCEVAKNKHLETVKKDMNYPVELPVPRIVHQILWSDSMKFRNYLSLLSVWKLLKPYVIMLYTRKGFEPQSIVYDDWFQKATSLIPNLQVVELGLLNQLGSSYVDETIGAMEVLKKRGGVYVNINTIVDSDLWSFLANRSFYAGLDDDSSISFMAASEDLNIKNSYRSFIEASSLCRCASMELYTGSEICSTVTKDIFPVTIMRVNSSFGSLARRLLYDNPAIPLPKTTFPPIPRLVHYVWFGNSDIDYSMVLSVVSTQRFVKPSKILIYVDQVLPRTLLDGLTKTYDNVEIVYYGHFKTIYQHPVGAMSHYSDFLRAELLYRYGGMYIDWDVYWLKPLDDLLSKGYETIASLDYYDDVYPRKTFPDTVNMGVVLARPNSAFIGLWRDSYKKYTGKPHTYHAVEYVYKLYEEHPDLLVLDDRVQIMCHELRCHPLWLDDYKVINAHHEFDFTKDVYAVHFTAPTPEPFMSEKLLRESKGYFADMARHVAGISKT